MKRKAFLRNIAISIAASLLPKILQPSNWDDEMVDVPVNITWVIGFDPIQAEYAPSQIQSSFMIRMRKDEADNFIAEYNSR